MRIPVAFLCAVLSTAITFAQAPSLRPPAVPLITHDPYLSIWSFGNQLTSGHTKHWTGVDQPLAGVIRIDGTAYRFLGGNWRWAEAPVQPFPQVSREVTPTRTLYGFEGSGIHLDLTFLTPTIASDLDLVSRPVTYLTFQVRSTDNRPHIVQLYFDAASDLAVNHTSEPVETLALRIGDIDAVRMGSVAQPILKKSGDNLRIDWGYLYLAAKPQAGLHLVRTNTRDRIPFLTTGKLPSLEGEWQGTDRLVAHIGAVADLGSVNTTAVRRDLAIAYDDLYSIEYFGRKLRPYWRRTGRANAETLLRDAIRDHAAIEQKARDFDASLLQKLTASGGAKYADIAVLAYRQTLAAHKLVADIDGTPLYFSKENFSNGCIGTVDVTYPSAPFFLALSPQLLKAQLRFILDYASMARWPWPYPPHDIGQYPLANGQVYGGGELTEDRQMPVEESGNMILLVAALAKAEGNADFAKRYWPLLSKWARYLEEKGLDPDNQLSTDDFAGHMAHNTNLSLKAITALGAYAKMARTLNETATASKYQAVAQKMAADWDRMAADGDHYRLAFDQPGTWSQKYNLIWDRLLSLDLFPPDVARKEIAWYLTKQNQYGLPLDNRDTYTKLDWIVWSATMAEKRTDFEALITPVHRFLHESPSRVPMTDWYWTDKGTQRGFQARSVVGGVYSKLLADMWKSR
jgi:hypothetical protein